MRVLPLFLLFGPVALASDPASLHVDLIQGKFLSFKLDNHYRKPVTRFEVGADFENGSLSCSLQVQVKRPEDLHPRGTCSGPIEKENWKAYIVYVEFANGMRWTPENQLPAN